jgi:hypothetical protein
MWRFGGIPIHLPQYVIGSAKLRGPISSPRLLESVAGPSSRVWAGNGSFPKHCDGIRL